jgi:hypothetical protein
MWKKVNEIQLFIEYEQSRYNKDWKGQLIFSKTFNSFKEISVPICTCKSEFIFLDKVDFVSLL